MLIVKANAYGIGYEAVTRVENLVDCYGIARVSEGIALRKLGVTIPIVLLSHPNGQLMKAVEYSLVPSVSTCQQMQDCINCQCKTIHIACDSGMNRFGFKSLESLEEMLKNCHDLEVQGVFSHFYSSESDIISKQSNIFDDFIELTRQYYPNAISHISSSSSWKACMGYDMIRLGISAYQGAHYFLSEILLIKNLSKGDIVSYNAEFVANSEMKIAIIEGGYADGIPRCYTGKKVVINNKECRIIGAICMDVFVVDVTNLKCQVGDRVVILDNEIINLNYLAEGMHKTEYEVMTNMKGRYNNVVFN